ALWTGSKMVVWGGAGVSLVLTNTGGIYDLASDTWTPTGLSGAPTPRAGFTAVWTGSRMIVWGGADSTGGLNTGGIYDDPTIFPSPTDFYTVAPCRLADTRNPVGPSGGPAL